MGTNGGGGQFDRSRSGSKRRRGENGDWLEGDNREKVQQFQPKQKQFVVGTSNNAARKMRSPPADIFVYGVHPDTSLEDIVQDLACSDIIIQTKDINKKSKEEAFRTLTKSLLKQKIYRRP